MERERVCVTGASGFIASWVVKLLLERGYTVHATVRTLKDPAKTEHLVCLDGAKERLHLFEANLMEQGSFDSAIQGCHGVFHIASPVITDSPNPQEDIVDPAVKGTLNVLNSCAKETSIKRVVFTSSTAAVIYVRPLTEEALVDETWFSTLEGCEAVPHAKWYLLSKTWAEQAAWKFAKEKGIDMVSINPACVAGPFSQSSLNYAASVLLDLINEPEKQPNIALGWVHVKDVAEAHIRAFEIPSANGRYILSENVVFHSEVVNILQELYPTLNLSNKVILEHEILEARLLIGATSRPRLVNKVLSLTSSLHARGVMKFINGKSFTLKDSLALIILIRLEEKVGAAYKLSKEKATSLGINFIPMRDAIKETIECLKDNKFINV